jgi:replicative superfamily II helicase
LSKDGGISPEEFGKYVEMLKSWNKKFTQSHLLAQMVLYGIGILSGDMPFDLQVFIRELFNSGIIVLLMTTEDCAYGINTPTKTVIVGDGISEIDRKQMKGRAGRKGLGFKAFFISLCGNFGSLDRIDKKVCEEENLELPIDSKKIYHFDPVIYEKFSGGDGDEDWINKNIEHIFLKDSDIEIEIDKEFYKKSYLLFGLGAILAPSILKELIKKTKDGESNRNIRIILGLIGCIPQNKPYEIKEEWNYEIPEKVLEIYKNNGLDYKPNWFAYQCLMNQKNDFSFSQKEEFIQNSKYWSYLFFLLLPLFKKILGENKGEELYNDIQELITNSIINI